MLKIILSESKFFKFFFLSLIITLAAYSFLYPLEFFPIDDAFYYYSISINSDNLFKTSYDGYTLTNGYQPLWMAISFILYKSLLNIGLEEFFLNSIFLINLLFLLGFLNTFRNLLNDFDIKLPEKPYKLYLLIFLSPIVFIHPAINIFVIFGGGIEFQMTLFLFSLWIRKAINYENLSISTFAFITVLLILARLDSALIIAPYFIYFSLHKRKSKVFLSGMLVFLTIASWLIFNQTTYGSYMPISGEVKSLWGGYDTNAGSLIDRIKDGIFQWLPISRMIFNGEYLMPAIRIIKTLLVFFLFLFIFKYFIRYKSFRNDLHMVMNKFDSFLYIMVLGFLLFIAYLASHLFTETKFWYYSFFYILLGILISSIIFSKPNSLFFKNIIIVYSFFTIIETSIYAFKQPVSDEYSYKRAIIEEVDNIANGRRVATPNSGVFGWYSNSKVSNMDGLVGDKEYYSYLKNNNVAKYWSDKNVVILINKNYLQKWPYQYIDNEFDCIELNTNKNILVCQ